MIAIRPRSKRRLTHEAFVQRCAWRAPRTVEEIIAQTPHEFRLAPVSHLFTAERIKARTQHHAQSFWPEGMKIVGFQEAFNKLIETVIREELNEVKSHLKFFRAPQRMRRKIDGPRKTTAYAAFCKEMRSKHPASQVIGKVRELWRALSADEKKVYETKANDRTTFGVKRPAAAFPSVVDDSDCDSCRMPDGGSDCESD